MMGVVGPVVFGICTLFGRGVVPGVGTAFGETVVPGAVTAFGLVFGNTVRPLFTDAPLFGMTTVPFGVMIDVVFGATVALGPAVFGATVELGPEVLGATVALGPVKALGLLVGRCMLAAPFGWMLLG